MDNQPPFNEQPGSIPPATGPQRKNRRWTFLLIALPLLLCVGWAVVAMYAMSVLNPTIPDTGGGEPRRQPVLATQDPGLPAQPSTPAPTLDPAHPNTYSDDAGTRLVACSASFRQFYVMEQLAAREPAMFDDDSWRSDAKKAIAAFQQDCGALGGLKNPPASYTEVDRWLKKAANEVNPAAQSFTAAMDQPNPIVLNTVEDHLSKFVEYIHNAETILDGMQQKKVI